MFNAICAGFKDLPAVCVPGIIPGGDASNGMQFVPLEEGIKIKVLIVIIVFLVLLNILIIYCYRRHQKREVQGEMAMQIETAVS